MTILRIVAQLAANIPNMHHHQVVGGVEIRLIPDALVDILYGKDLLGMLGEQQKDPIFDVRQWNLPSVLTYQRLARVNFDVSTAANDTAMTRSSALCSTVAIWRSWTGMRS